MSRNEMKKIIAFALLAIAAISVQTPGFAAGPETYKSGCVYIAGTQVKADVPCTVKVYANATSATEVWEWDNGNHTEVKMSDAGITVNGQTAEKFDASEILDVEEPVCYRIKASGKIYCWGV